ncbi:unnamed protein product, partial [Ascophyllum nodosum]
STIAFCVDYPVHLSIEGTSVVKTDSEGWAVFLGRRIVLPFLEVSSPDCNQNRTGLVRAGKQRMRVVAGSEGATDESTPDCSCSVDLKPADYASKATDRRSVSDRARRVDVRVENRRNELALGWLRASL